MHRRRVGIDLRDLGRAMPCGRSRRTVAMCSRTSCAAMSVSSRAANCAMTSETPSVEIERSSSMPLMVLTASSILSVTSVSTASGDAPGYGVTMVTSGKSTFGNWSTPSLLVADEPDDDEHEIRTDREDRAPDADVGEPLHGGYSVTLVPSTISSVDLGDDLVAFGDAVERSRPCPAPGGAPSCTSRSSTSPFLMTNACHVLPRLTTALGGQHRARRLADRRRAPRRTCRARDRGW